mmetsp:Transcript_22036/g.53343  ORF Transcript_22036/g.53343 Transcript_22036/m.53343 type:complete len:230 (-) Transcript_22036:129-818(-)|eukprot:CAMPEP_0181090416 /NCGR_PEP_ID=MMETSP1071-20121207/7840_1 /TAXON_ID=35127 /ORGANISM="Thalassiosira sp., Strain NH16" /LENGTH=229 /DNA_ID=CAMNT_0023172461 /DNA_START=109 /DNA_END=798 /DNA_ORIENTATION=-
MTVLQSISRYGPAITASDMTFSVGFLAYICIANFVTFDSNKLQMSQLAKKNIAFEPMGKHSLGRGKFIVEKSFVIYFICSKIMSLLVPLLLVIAGPLDIAVMVIPSLINVVAQAIAEQSTASFHDVLRILVPIGYSSHRLFGPVTTWALNSWSLWLQKQEGGEFASNRSYYVYTFNLVLAWANLAFAAWNLFGFLLLRVLPLYFDNEETPRIEMAYILLPLPKKHKKQM